MIYSCKMDKRESLSLSLSLSWLVLSRSSVQNKSLSEIALVSQNGYCSNSLAALDLWGLAFYLSCLCNRSVSCHDYDPVKSVYVSYQYLAFTFSITCSCSLPFLLAYFSIAESGTPPSVLASMLKNFLCTCVWLEPVFVMNF